MLKSNYINTFVKINLKTMKIILKKYLLFACGITYFAIICVPLACLLFVTATLIFEIKNLYKWITK